MFDAPDVNSPWGYFYGATYAKGANYGGGFVFYLTKQHYFQVSLGVGRGSNKREVLSYKSLISLCPRKGL